MSIEKEMWKNVDLNDRFVGRGVIKIDDAIKIAKKYTKRTCQWKQEDNFHLECNSWQTNCGNLYQITEGTPKENDMKFCLYCGGKLTDKK